MTAESEPFFFYGTIVLGCSAIALSLWLIVKYERNRTEIIRLKADNTRLKHQRNQLICDLDRLRGHKAKGGSA